VKLKRFDSRFESEREIRFQIRFEHKRPIRRSLSTSTVNALVHSSLYVIYAYAYLDDPTQVNQCIFTCSTVMPNFVNFIRSNLKQRSHALCRLASSTRTRWEGIQSVPDVEIINQRINRYWITSLQCHQFMYAAKPAAIFMPLW